MKGYFSIEWLSQSSQETSGTGSRGQVDPWLLAGPQSGPYASSTQPESLPGFYSSHGGGSAQLQEGPAEKWPLRGHIHCSPIGTHQGPGTESRLSLHSSTQGYWSSGIMKPRHPRIRSRRAGRRPRTAFTAEQINQLEKVFKRNAYLGTQDKAELCKRLSLSDKQIRNWFQNRRMKLKRTLQDALAQACQAKATSQLMQYPEVQAFWPSYYPVHESPAPYVTPSSMRYTPQATVGSNPTMSLDSLYQCTSMPGLVVSAASTPLMNQYHPYPHHY
ncbi:hypothetical protein SKAU_G00362920 [Synaphobranchus kaupii]|uniref:Homeobox domain-containing protein n=1 Tax=Synaphobranchus kaupii TaxID=118154 RepID=A0A9Q1EIN6_SYNKA|nr:hypothetical protein SKAU_G00362920 [Synaphobranchus kaupii]